MRPPTGMAINRKVSWRPQPQKLSVTLPLMPLNLPPGLHVHPHPSPRLCLRQLNAPFRLLTLYSTLRQLRWTEVTRMRRPPSHLNPDLHSNTTTPKITSRVSRRRLGTFRNTRISHIPLCRPNTPATRWPTSQNWMMVSTRVTNHCLGTLVSLSLPCSPYPPSWVTGHNTNDSTI